MNKKTSFFDGLISINDDILEGAQAEQHNVNDGILLLIKFPNGMEASIIRHSSAYCSMKSVGIPLRPGRPADFELAVFVGNSSEQAEEFQMGWANEIAINQTLPKVKAYVL